MKKLLIALTLAIPIYAFGGNLLPGVYSSSFRGEVVNHIGVIEANPSMQSYSTVGAKAKRIIKFSYAPATHGGAPGLHSVGVTIPAGSLIVRDFFFLQSSITPGTATISAQCEDAVNILATATIPAGGATGAYFEGKSTGTAANFSGSIAADCAINISISAGNVTATAGTLEGFVEYVNEQ